MIAPACTAARVGATPASTVGARTPRQLQLYIRAFIRYDLLHHSHYHYHCYPNNIDNLSNDTCAVMRYHWRWGRPYLGHTQHATTWIVRAPSPDPDASMVVNDVPRDPVTNPKYRSLWPVFLFACFLCSPYFPCLPLEHGYV